MVKKKAWVSSSSKTKMRAKIVDKCLIMVWSSLFSHLGWTYTKLGNPKLNGTNMFQKKTVKEYSELIFLISQLY